MKKNNSSGNGRFMTGYFHFMEKRGISAIVATVLLILIIVAGVTIVYVGILPMFNQITEFTSGDVELGIVLEGYTAYDDKTGYIFVQVNRGSDDLELAGLEIIFEVSGNSVTYRIEKDEVPLQNQKATYAFNFANAGLNQKPDKVKVLPIILRDGKEVRGEVTSEVILPKGSIELTDIRRVEANNRAPKDSKKYYYDGDKDGYGNSSNFTFFNSEPIDTCFSLKGGDCNDNDENINLGKDEICGNEKDDDCDGEIDEDCSLEDNCDFLGGEVLDSYCLGDELIKNGNFTNDEEWSFNNGWSWSNTYQNAELMVTPSSILSQATLPAKDSSYLFSYNVNGYCSQGSSFSINPSFSGSPATLRTKAGSYSEILILMPGPNSMIFTGGNNGCNIWLDDVSLREVLIKS